MENISEEIIKVKNTFHTFYCDGCNECLGTSMEHEDGWYKEIGEFKLELNVDGWMRIKKHFCPKCQDKFINKIRQNLLDIGFKIG